MSPGIVIPIVLLPILLFAIWTWYARRFRTAPADEPRELSGVRLTAETLRRLVTPQWRVVYEIGDRLPGIDHVVIGPPGVIGITTRVGDRPDPARLATTLDTSSTESRTSALAALARAPLDALLESVLDPGSIRSIALARVFWGAPDTTRPAAETTIDHTPFVEGQRLIDWLTGLDAGGDDGPALTPARVDAAWRAVVIGIGRPDPLS